MPPLDLGDDAAVLDFDGSDPLAPATGGRPLRVRREGDASPKTTQSGDGTKALVFPAYRPEDGRRLVLVLLGTGAARSRVPDTSTLSFGADVDLDEGAGSGPEDNGDNVLQRGLFVDAYQYKLQVDKKVPSCTVRTPRADSFASLGHRLGSGWYRLSCRYDGTVLRLTASPFEAAATDGGAVSTPALAGALSFAAATPVSVGGKVSATGELVRTQPDQFNGALDNVYVSPGP